MNSLALAAWLGIPHLRRGVHHTGAAPTRSDQSTQPVRKLPLDGFKGRKLRLSHLNTANWRPAHLRWCSNPAALVKQLHHRKAFLQSTDDLRHSGVWTNAESECRLTLITGRVTE